MERRYSSEKMELKGILTEDMLEKFNIPLEKTKKHGSVKLTYGNYTLYEVPSPYNEITVFYGFYGNDKIAPSYYFSQKEIEDYNLTPIGKSELPTIECGWDVFLNEHKQFKNVSIMQFLYNRKDEEKYRIKFLMDPNFNPRIWEAEQYLKKYK